MTQTQSSPDADQAKEDEKIFSRSKFIESARFVWSYWRKSPWVVAQVIVFLIFAAVAEACLPLAAKMLTFAVQEGNISLATGMLGGFIGLSLLSMVCSQLGYRARERHTASKIRAMLGDVFKRVGEASVDWHANTFAGSTISKLNRGLRAFMEFADVTLNSIFYVGIVFIGLLVSMFIQSPLLAGATALTIALYIFVSIKFASRYVIPINRKAIAQDNILTGTVADAITCNTTVKAFGAEQRELDHLDTTLDGWGKVKTKLWLRRMDMFLLMESLSMLNWAAVIGVTLYLWSLGKADASDVAFALTVIFMISGYIGQIPRAVHGLMNVCNELEDVITLSKMQLDIRDSEGAQEAHIPNGEIAFKNVKFGYNGQVAPLFDGLEVHLRAGETIGLVGRSGSGKSTFVKLLQRFYDIHDGSIEVDGVDIRHVTQSSLRRHIALVPQDPVLFHRSLADNIRYARPDATMDEVTEAAKKAYAHEFIAASPQGYETLVGERGIKLSGGERQRIAIARALLSQAPILVMDEATSSLDSLSEQLIQRAVERAMQDQTTVIIAHRLSTLRAVDRILVFDGGQIVEDGSHATLIKLPNGYYRRLYETQSLGLVDGNLRYPSCSHSSTAAHPSPAPTADEERAESEKHDEPIT